MARANNILPCQNHIIYTRRYKDISRYNYTVMMQSNKNIQPFFSHGIHQIFYENSNKFDQPSSIDQLSQWMYSDMFCLERPIVSSLIVQDLLHCPIEFTVEKHKSIDLPGPVIHIPVQEQNHSIAIQPNIMHEKFIPKKEDTLFWCAYTVYHGEATYHIIGNRYKNTEIDEKTTLVNFMREKTLLCKTSGHKISNARLQETQAELLVNKQTSWHVFHIMCLFYQFHAVVVYNKTYMEFSPNGLDDPAMYQFERNAEGHISVRMSPLTHDQIDVLRKTHIKLDYSMDKPLRAASSYKMEDLMTMAKVLDIDMAELSPQKPKKADWYEAITNACTW